MKPLNADSQSCDPISSNCVIWQGPDISCISLCKGDTVSTVVAKLATELCTVMDTLNITNYDLSCFNLTSCAPKDFEALIQFLIERVCKLENCTGCIPDCAGNSTSPTRSPIGTTSSGCPDCTVAIASCFYYKNEFGDQVTEMQLVDYVRTLGNYICQLAGQITTINQILNAYNIRITNLENAPVPTYTLPEFTPVCVLPATPTDIATILEALEAQFCQLRSATGTPDQIYAAIVKQCSGLNTAPILGPGGGTMASLTGWVNSPVNLADSITNMWLTICDLRNAVANIKINCCPDGCGDVAVSMQLVLTGSTLKMFFTGNIPAGFGNCTPAGTLFTITDSSGGLVNTYVDLTNYMNDPAGFSINLSATPINLSDNLTVSGSPCFYNNLTNTTCQSYIQEVYYNTVTCPSVILTALLTSISYNSVVPAGLADYTIEVYDGTGSTLISSYTQTITGPGVFSGTVGGLTSGTLYKVRLVITINGVSTNCPFQNVSTNGVPCDPPDTVVATITL